jgi:hypothetical protein
MTLRQNGRIFRAVAWRAAERHDYLTEHKAAVDVAFSLEQNQFNGETHLELNLSDMKGTDRHLEVNGRTEGVRDGEIAELQKVGIAGNTIEKRQ